MQKVKFKQYYYNKSHWGIEEAYKAFGPQMGIYFDTDFVKECKGRTWIITSRKQNILCRKF